MKPTLQTSQTRLYIITLRWLALEDRKHSSCIIDSNTDVGLLTSNVGTHTMYQKRTKHSLAAGFG